MTSDGTRKGQIWSIDMLSGITLMTVLILLFAFEWNTLALRWNESSTYDELLGKALLASDALFTTPGDPPGWEHPGMNLSAAYAIGLADTRDSLDNEKLERLMDMNSSQNYSLVLSKIGLAGCQVYLTISDLYGDPPYYVYGQPSGLNNSAVVERFVLLNGTTVAKATLEVWQ